MCILVKVTHTPILPTDVPLLNALPHWVQLRSEIEVGTETGTSTTIRMHLVEDVPYAADVALSAHPAVTEFEVLPVPQDPLTWVETHDGYDFYRGTELKETVYNIVPSGSQAPEGGYPKAFIERVKGVKFNDQ